jgi:hypothetical protein
MAEVLAVAASIITVIQITDRVISLCCGFMGKVRGAEKEALQMVNGVTGLKGFLEFLHTFVKDEENAPRLPLLNSLCDPGGPLEVCTSALTNMETKMRPKRDHTGVLKPVTWLWKWNEIAQILKDIELQKTHMMLAMQGDTTRTALTIETTVNRIHSTLQDTNHKEILQWLTKTDPIDNHRAACDKREPGTGEWFLSSHEFSYWMLPGRSMWLHGIPGAGKTVLCSTIIQTVASRCSPDVPCLYFYFDFSNQQKQTVVNMLYSFLAQLSTRAAPPEVTKLYEHCNKGTQEATIAQLTDTLLAVADHEKGMYIIADALDESSDWRSLLKVVETLLQSNINLLMTSRKERDLQAVLENSVEYVVAIQDERVDADVNLHIQRCLRNDPDLNKWDDELKLEIVAKLTSGAKGM